MQSDPLSLHEVLTRAKRALALNFPTALWIRAEVTSLTERRGHRYLQFTEKGDAQQVLAKADGQLWANDYGKVLRARGKSAGEVLDVGREVCFQAELELHEVYGLKLRIVDWDPAFTLGQLEMQRRAILERLSSEGLIGLNARLAPKLVYQRLAVVTSETAAGYADFRDQLKHNPYGFAYDIVHFDVAVQGVNTVPSVTAALAQINAQADRYDAVCILRGGGSRLDLASFDDYDIGAAIALSRVPVLVGIGHEIDETIPDHVAHTSLKTPTALAEHLIHHNAQFEALQVQLARRIARHGQVLARAAATLLDRQAAGLNANAVRRLTESGAFLSATKGAIRAAAAQAFAKTDFALTAAVRQVEALDPNAVLRRGYSITKVGGRTLTSPDGVAAGQHLTTIFADGQTLRSITE